MKKIISMMGSEGCGKTCFLAGLSWLGSAGIQSDFCVVGEGASQSYLNELLKALREGNPPNPTHATRDLSFDVIYKGVRYGFGIQDFAGEEFKRQGVNLDLDKSPIYNRIKGSDILLVVLDCQRDVCDAEKADLDRLDAVLHIFAREEIASSGKQIAVILSKADLYGYSKGAPEMDPRQFLEERNPVLFQKFEALKLAPSYFFLSSLGSDMQNGQEPAPIGYEPIFQWMSLAERTRQLAASASRTFRNRWVRAALSLVLLGLLGCLIYYVWSETKATAIKDGQVPEDRINIGIGSLPQGDKKDQLVDTRIQEFTGRLNSAKSFSECCQLHDDVEKCRKEINPTQTQADRLRDLSNQVARKATGILFSDAKRDFGNNRYEDCQNEINKFRKVDWLSHEHQGFADLEKKLKCIFTEKAKRKIAKMPCQAATQISAKCSAVEAYSGFSSEEKKEAERAVKVVELLNDRNHKFSIVVKSAGRLESSHRTYLELSVGNRSYTSSKVKAREPLWDDTISSFDWKKEDPIHVKWYWKSSWGPYPVRIADLKIEKGLTSLLELLDAPELKEKSGAQVPSVEGNPTLKIECADFPNPKKDLELVRKYICPGSYWGGL